jgi:gas vesicle protein
VLIHEHWKEANPSMSDESHGAGFLTGLILGGLIGAGAALLLAPQPGDETRAELREKGIELRERVLEISEEARRRAEELQVEGRSAVETQVARVEEAIEEGKKAASKKKEQLRDELEQAPGEAQA